MKLSQKFEFIFSRNRGLKLVKVFAGKNVEVKIFWATLNPCLVEIINVEKTRCNQNVIKKKNDESNVIWRKQILFATRLNF